MIIKIDINYFILIIELQYKIFFECYNYFKI